MRYTIGRPVVLSHVFEDDYSDDPVMPQVVTVTATRDGATAATFTGAATASGSGYTVSAGLLPQGVYEVVWDGGTVQDAETIEVVGGHLFTVSQLRNSDVDLSRYSRDDILAVRDVVAQEFQTITGRSFVPRTVREQWFAGEPLPRLDVATATVYDNTGTSLGAASIKHSGAFSWLPDYDPDSKRTLWVGWDGGSGYIPYEAPLWNDNEYTVELDYGFRTVPTDIREAALLRAKALLFESNSGIPDRATSFQTTNGGTYTLSTAGKRGAQTGIPDVDAVLVRYSFVISDSIGGFW